MNEQYKIRITMASISLLLTLLIIFGLKYNSNLIIICGNFDCYLTIIAVILTVISAILFISALFYPYFVELQKQREEQEND